MVQPEEHAQVPVAPPIIFLAFLIGALVLHRLLPIPLPFPGTTRIVGGAAVFGGLLLAGQAVRLMLKAHTSPDPHQPTTALITTGPYRMSRNPIYLGFTLIYLGFTWLVATLWGLLLAPLLLIVVSRVVISAEERYLLGKFGARYGEYRTRVRPWL